jgi:hypothetical protein
MRQAILGVVCSWLACALAWGGALPWCVGLEHAPRQPRSNQAVEITLRTREELTAAMVEYQVVEPGSYIELNDKEFSSNWVSLAMRPRDGGTGGTIYAATVPREVQKHRRLIRYRFAVTLTTGEKLHAPAPGELSPNYAYFVYDAVPAWTGAINPGSLNPKLKSTITFPPEVMSSVQVYQIIAKKVSVENVTWNDQDMGKRSKYTCTLVANGQVHDHVPFRARGGVWRYAIGKNMWKFDFPDEDRLRAVDDFGRPYVVSWSKLNLRPCIQMGSHGHRGEQGMFEAVGFRLFNLAGVPAPRTHWVNLRIVNEVEETPKDQYRGDFWGLYLAIENEDGRFLKEHKLADGNLYKMANGTGELKHQGSGMPAGGADLARFMADYQDGSATDAWWRENLDLKAYYSYRAICECIHHYDIGAGKNYDYLHDPLSRKWQVIPWDIDQTWADEMSGDGDEPFKRLVLSHPAFRIEYQNRLREIRDLLFNPEQMDRLIDGYAVIIQNGTGPSLAEADRRKWDYHPALASATQGGQGLFYASSSTRDFAGMVAAMKAYVRTRGRWVDERLLNDPRLPSTPSLTYTGPAGFGPGQLGFKASAYQGANPFAAIEWRLAQAPSAGAARAAPAEPAVEITALWQSDEFKEAGREVVIPTGIAKAGQTYRVRARVKDITGRWSHWSAPFEFTAATSK